MVPTPKRYVTNVGMPRRAVRPGRAPYPRRSSSSPRRRAPFCWPAPRRRVSAACAPAAPAANAWPACCPAFVAARITAVAPSTSSSRSRSSPARLMPPIRCLPPVECSFGVRPARRRSGGPSRTRRIDSIARVKRDTADRRDVASTLLTGLALCAASFASSVSICRRVAELLAQHDEHLFGLRRDGAASTAASIAAILPGPLPAIMPNSAAWPRTVLISRGSLPHQRLTYFSTIPWACCSTVLTGTGDAGAPRGLADRPGVVAVVLAAFDERLDILRRDQPYLVAERRSARAPSDASRRTSSAPPWLPASKEGIICARRVPPQNRLPRRRPSAA